MKSSRRRLNWVLGAIVLVAGVMLFKARYGDDPGPSFEGRTLRAWLDDGTLSEPETRRAVRSIGTNAIPHLQRWVLQRPGLIEKLGFWIGRRTPYLEIGFHPSLEANTRGAWGFHLLGEMAEPAVPWLEQQASLKDADFGFYIGMLAEVGPAGWTVLDRFERSAKASERETIILALCLAVRTWPELVERIQVLLQDEQTTVREATIWGLDALEKNCPDNLVEALRDRLEVEEDAGLREMIRRVLARLHPSDP